MSERTMRASASTLANSPAPLSLLPSAGNGPLVSSGKSSYSPAAAPVVDGAAAVACVVVGVFEGVVVAGERVVLGLDVLALESSSSPHATSNPSPNAAKALIAPRRLSLATNIPPWSS